MSKVAIASSSEISAAAGERIVREGGNAVDAALAAALVSAVSEPGVCALGAGAYLSIWPADGDPVTIDANVAVPGLGLPESALGRGGQEIFMEYGGGISTVVGHGSVATPGRAGRLRSRGAPVWHDCPGGPYCSPPSTGPARDSPCPWRRTITSGSRISSCLAGMPQSHAALHTSDGEILTPGSLVHVAGAGRLAAARSPRKALQAFYEGDLATAMTDDIAAHGGGMTRRDLDRISADPTTVSAHAACGLAGRHQPGARRGRRHPVGHASAYERPATGRVDRRRSSAPGGSPAPGAGLSPRPPRSRSRISVPAIEELIRLAESGQLDAMTAPSTVHVSTVDDTGLACSITMSAGYGSGVMPPGTGIWLNNCLGELELNRSGLAAGPPGRRLPSNMAPCVARSSHGDSLAIGSPGRRPDHHRHPADTGQFHYPRTVPGSRDSLAAPACGKRWQVLARGLRAWPGDRRHRTAIASLRRVVDVFRRCRRGAAQTGWPPRRRGRPTPHRWHGHRRKLSCPKSAARFSGSCASRCCC